MSWSVTEDWTGGSAGSESEQDGTTGRSDLQRTFNLVPLFDGATALDALNAPGLPLLGSPHPQSLIMRARRKNVTQAGPRYFTVTVGYDALTVDPQDPSQSPLTRPPVISFSSVTQEVEIDEDIFGNPIQTINGEPLVGVTRPFTDLVITVQRNLPSFNPQSISTYMNKVNSTAWYGLPAGTVRIVDIAAGNVFSEDFEYWDVSVQFQVRRGFGPVTDAKAWWHRTAHQGYRVWNGTALVNATEADGTTVAQPVMIETVADDSILVGQGARLAAGVGRYIDFQVLETIDFNTLNLL
jgi:hypothetical protein